MKAIIFSETHYLIMEAIQNNLVKGRIRSIFTTCDEWLKDCGTPTSIGNIHAFVKKLENLEVLKVVSKTKSLKHGVKTRPAAVYQYDQKRFDELNIMPKGSVAFKGKGEITTTYLLERKKILEERIAGYERLIAMQRIHLAKVESSIAAISSNASSKQT
jgi:hypothetical protein